MISFHATRTTHTTRVPSSHQNNQAATDNESTTDSSSTTDNQPKGPFARAGALLGFCAALYACIVYVKPFWDEQKGINNDGAIALTILTYCIGIGSVTGMGAAVGNCVDKLLGSSSDTSRLPPSQTVHVHHYHTNNSQEMGFFQPQQSVSAVAMPVGNDDIESNKQATLATAVPRW